MTDLDERFRSLERTPTPDLWTDITDRMPKVEPPRSGGHRLVAAVLAAVVAVAGFAVAVVAFQSEPGAIDPPVASPMSALRGDIAATFPVGEDPRSVVYGAGSIWVAVSNNDGTSGGRILRIDPVTNETVAEIAVATIPTWEVGGGAMDVYGDSLWVTGGVDAPGSFDSPGGGSDAAVLRIDVTTNEVIDLFRLGGTTGADLTFLDGALWVLAFGDESVDNVMEVVRVNETTGEVLTRIPLTAGWAHTLVAADSRLVVYEGGERAVNVGGHITSIDPVAGATTQVEIRSGFGWPAVWRGEVWIASDSGFARFDPASAAVTVGGPEFDPTRFAFCCGSVEADDRAIWFLGRDGLEGEGPVRLTAFDPTTDGVTELATLREGNPVAMAIAPESVWVLSYEGTLTKVALLPSESPVATKPFNPLVTATIEVGAFPRGIAVGEDSIWATVSAGEPEDFALVRIDPTTNEVVDTMSLSWPGDVVVGAGAVWVNSEQGGEAVVLRIDEITGDVIAAITVGAHPSSIAYGFGDIWVTAYRTVDAVHDEVVRIDPETNQVVSRIPVVGGEARDVVAGAASVWVYGHSRHSGGSWEASSLWRIDPTTNEVVATVLDQNGFLGAGGFLPDNVVEGEGWVWAADDRGNGVRIDPTTGAVTTFELPQGGFAWPYAVYAGHVFFGLGSIEVLDTETLEVVTSIPLEWQVADAALDPDTGTLWIANYEGTVTRIDLR